MNKEEDILDIQFAPWNKWDDGIPKRKTKYNGSWIKINTIMVPTGFVRSDHERYSELRPKISGYIKLYDELIENTYLIKVFKKDVEKEVINKLEEAGFVLNRIDDVIKERAKLN